MTRTRASDFTPSHRVLSRYAKALAHPARIAILRTLAERATCVCGEIVEVMPLAQSTVSQHLKELKEAGLIRGEIEGTKSCYCVDKRAVRDLRKLMDDLLGVLTVGTQARRRC